ncbi:MAG: hypothetical protein MJ216_02120 [Bacilli bacterium]|nr:hypothetical protein [Bacilli bacterium]
MSLSLVACGGNAKKEPCEKHTWGEYEITEPATCEAAGKKKAICTVCGAEDEKTVSKLSHKYSAFEDETHKNVEANCKQAGVKYEKCELCGDIKSTELKQTDHVFGEGAAQAAVANANTPSKLATCKSCDKAQITWNVGDYDKALSSSDLPALSNNGMKFNKVYNQTKPTGDENSGTEGNHIDFTVASPKAATKATLAFFVTTNSNSAPIFNSVDNDQAPSYEWNGTEWVRAAKRYKLFVNDVEYKLGDDSYGDVAGSTQDWFDFPCEFPLVQGMNKIELQCYGGYRPTMFQFALKY